MANDTERTIIDVKGVPPPLGAYSHALSARPGKLIFIAGQVSINEQGETVGLGDLAAQTRQVYHNLEQILTSAGATFRDVVRFSTFIKKGETLENYMDARRGISPRIYPDNDYPPNTLLIIERLVKEEFLIEVEATVALP